MIAALWGDLNPAQGGQVIYATVGTAPNRIFVLEFDHVFHYGTTVGSAPATFQVQLYETSNIIEVHYQDAPGFNDYQTGFPANQSAGIERDAFTGLQYYYGTSSLPTPRTVRYQQTQPPLILRQYLPHVSR